MKVTKYPQSCLLLEKDGKRIVIDPGSFFTAKYKLDVLGPIDAVLYTHQHADHFDETLIDPLKSANVALYGNSAVAGLIGEGAIEVKNGVSFDIAGFQVVPHDLPHCLMPDGSEGPMNTGYIIDGVFFHPGDGIETSNLQVSSVALPIAGPSISFYQAGKFATQLGAKKVIPIHYDNVGLFPGNPAGFAKVFTSLEVIVLADGESAEI